MSARYCWLHAPRRSRILARFTAAARTAAAPGLQGRASFCLRRPHAAAVFCELGCERTPVAKHKAQQHNLRRAGGEGRRRRDNGGKEGGAKDCHCCADADLTRQERKAINLETEVSPRHGRNRRGTGFRSCEHVCTHRFLRPRANINVEILSRQLPKHSAPVFFFPFKKVHTCRVPQPALAVQSVPCVN